MTDREQFGDITYVRQRWETVWAIPEEVTRNTSSIEDLWKARADYTEAREQQIKWKEEEIAFMSETVKTSKTIDELPGQEESNYTAIAERILATLTEQLAELKKGWKE